MKKIIIMVLAVTASFGNVDIRNIPVNSVVKLQKEVTIPAYKSAIYGVKGVKVDGASFCRVDFVLGRGDIDEGEELLVSSMTINGRNHGVYTTAEGLHLRIDVKDCGGSVTNEDLGKGLSEVFVVTKGQPKEIRAMSESGVENCTENVNQLTGFSDQQIIEEASRRLNGIQR